MVTESPIIAFEVVNNTMPPTVDRVVTVEKRQKPETVRKRLEEEITDKQFLYAVHANVD